MKHKYYLRYFFEWVDNVYVVVLDLKPIENMKFTALIRDGLVWFCLVFILYFDLMKWTNQPWKMMIKLNLTCCIWIKIMIFLFVNNFRLPRAINSSALSIKWFLNYCVYTIIHTKYFWRWFDEWQTSYSKCPMEKFSSICTLELIIHFQYRIRL